MQSDYEFALPYPPSINSLRACVRNRLITSKKGREYRADAIAALDKLSLSGEAVTNDLSMVVTLNPPTLRRYDVDNYSKAILDALTHANFWIDDEQVQSLTVRKGEKVKGGRVDISIMIKE